MSDTEVVLLSGSAVAAAVLCLAIYYFVRVLAPALFGPMFRYEIVRVSRRGLHHRLRALFVALLLVGLFVTYLREFQGQEVAALRGQVQIDQNRGADVARTFLILFLSIQLLAVMLIAPAVVGSAITEEKDRGTLDFLRSSMLSDREIVLGKMAARLVFVLGIVLAGLPVLMLTMLFGGIDDRILLAGYVVTAVTAVTLGTYAFQAGLQADNLRDALVRVYGVTVLLSILGLCCGCVPGISAVSPPSVLFYMFIRDGDFLGGGLVWINAGLFVLLHGGLSLLFVRRAVVQIRTRPDPKGKVEEVVRPVHTPTTDTRHPEFARRSFVVPRVGNGDPLLWKERHFSGRIGGVDREMLIGCGVAVLATFVFGMGMVVFIGATVELNKGRWTGESLNPPFRTFLTSAALLVPLAVGVRAAGSVARERQKQTIDGLFSLPVERADLLWAKWVASYLWGRYVLATVGVVVAAGCLTMAAHPAGLFVAVLHAAAFLVFALTFGVWLSVRCRTVLQATVFFMLGLLTLWLLPVLLAPLAGAVGTGVGGPAQAELYTGMTMNLSLPVGVWNCTMSWVEYREPRSARESFSPLVAGFAAAALLLALTLWMRWDGERRFEREGK